ncbi:MAG TPA: hypothetical protein DEP47_07215 [Chloroflexi bacterium]|nr:hypothetical protein [Chloroflexota bacterium]
MSMVQFYLPVPENVNGMIAGSAGLGYARTMIYESAFHSRLLRLHYLGSEDGGVVKRAWYTKVM